MDKLSIVKNKISTQEDLTKWLSWSRFQQKKIVFTNGCFDIIHRGHIEYLAKAASFGDLLVIGLNTDSSVKRLKGEKRPLLDQLARATILAALQFVDKVVYFEEDTPLQLIQFIQPHVLVKGSDYKAENIVGYDVVKQNGGIVVTIDFIDGYSTSSIIEKARL